jgi:chromosome segregation ATPase
MFIFKPKYARIEDQDNKKDDSSQAQAEEKTDERPASVTAATAALSADIIKLKAQFDQFSELRKVINERFTRINEQVGELRGMIMDSNRSMQDMEVKTVKAVDLVEAVHPDKLMVEVRKQDAKIESLKAGIESNDSIMKSLMDQLKDMRHEVSTFRGIEQVVQLNDEVKNELMNIKKIEATVERHSDKIEGIFIESQKRFQEFESLTDKLKEVQKQLSSLIEQSDQSKVKLATAASKKEVEDLVNKFNDFEKHVGNIIDLLTKRANDLPKEIDDRFKKLEKSMNDAFEKHLKRAETLNSLIEKIEKEAPKISKEMQLSEKLKEVDVKKIESQPSAELKESVAKVEEEKKGFFANLFGGKKKEAPPEKK